MTPAMRAIKKMFAAAEKEQATHRRRWGKCMSSCETIQELSVLGRVIDAVAAAEKRAHARKRPPPGMVAV